MENNIDIMDDLWVNPDSNVYKNILTEDQVKDLINCAIAERFKLLELNLMKICNFHSKSYIEENKYIANRDQAICMFEVISSVKKMNSYTDEDKIKIQTEYDLLKKQVLSSIKRLGI